jgi:DNA-binding transcriptional LysR family regulator
MDLRLLKTFQMVATTLNFSQAADALDYAQSTVTAQIQSLEAEMGVQLFNRVGRHVELTSAGRRLLEYSDRLLDLEEETRVVVGGAQDVSGTLTIGAPETVCTYRLPQVLRRFRQQMPGIRLIFRPLRPSQLADSIKTGIIDIAFLLEQNVQSGSLLVETLIPEPLAIVAAVDHPLALLDRVVPALLEGQPLLLTERGCGYRRIFESVLSEIGVLPTSNMEFDSVEAIKQCVIANVGIAMLPEVAVKRELDAGDLVRLPWFDERFFVYTHMLWHRDKWVSPAMEAFIALSREILIPMGQGISVPASMNQLSVK